MSDILFLYKELVRFALDSGSAPGLSVRRDDLARMSLADDQSRHLSALDEEALEYILDLDWIDPDLIADMPGHDLRDWWWHLGKIRNHSYPAELLPQHLRAIYQQPKSKAI